MYSRTFDLGQFTADQSNQYHPINVDLTGASEIWVVGTLSWPVGYSPNFRTWLISDLGGAAPARCPLLQESTSEGVFLSVKADLRGVEPQNNLDLRVFDFDNSSEYVDMDLVAVLTYC